MTETDTPPSAEIDDLPPPPPPPEPRTGRNVVPVFYLAGFLVLAGAIAYLWVNTQNLPPPADSTADLQGITQQLQSIDARLTKLEQLSGRVAALEQRPAGGDTSALAGRITALEQRADTASQLASRYDALAGRVDALSGKTQTGEADLDHRVDALETKLNGLAGAADQLDHLKQREAQMARVQAAMAALRAGHKLGDLPNAPPALTRFAATDPPTEADLRLRFPAVERAALAASRPDTEGKPFLDRIWLRAQTLVTVRQGDDVVVGDAASGVLARAREDVDAGDLAGAVIALSALKGPAAQAVAPWLNDAKALLAAQTALTEMAEQS
jgi:hypothetical protein